MICGQMTKTCAIQRRSATSLLLPPYGIVSYVAGAAFAPVVGQGLWRLWAAIGKIKLPAALKATRIGDST